MQVGIQFLDATLVARVAAVQLHGKRYAAASLAVGEAFPEGAFADVALHWGCARHKGGGWEPPPAGWHTVPDASFGAGALRRPLHQSSRDTADPDLNPSHLTPHRVRRGGALVASLA